MFIQLSMFIHDGAELKPCVLMSSYDPTLWNTCGTIKTRVYSICLNTIDTGTYAYMNIVCCNVHRSTRTVQCTCMHI